MHLSSQREAGTSHSDTDCVTVSAMAKAKKKAPKKAPKKTKKAAPKKAAPKKAAPKKAAPKKAAPKKAAPTKAAPKAPAKAPAPKAPKAPKPAIVEADSSDGSAKAQVISLFRDFYSADDWAEDKILDTDPNGFDLDPGPFYEQLQEMFNVADDPDSQYFGGFGGKVSQTIAFIDKQRATGGAVASDPDITLSEDDE